MVPPGMLQRKRIVLMLLAIGASLLLLAARLVYLQAVQSDSLRVKAVNVRTRVVPVQARRGDIIDRNGEVLADSVDVYSVFANPSLITDKSATAARLAPILGVAEDTLLRRLQTRTLFIWLRRRVSDAAATAVRAADIPGIQLARESRRVFPEGTLAAQVLGFSGIDNQGLAGVEYEYNAQLQGQAGEMISEYDARNHPIPRAQQEYVPPVDGLTLQLTIDARLQLDAERELAKAVATHAAIGGSVLIMDPQTGEILALANQPTFDPGDPTAAPQRTWRDFAVSDTMSPGSVFKPITAAAGIQDGLVGPGSGFYDPGFLRVGGWTIHNAEGEALGPTSFAAGFAHSAKVEWSVRAGRAVPPLGPHRYRT